MRKLSSIIIHDFSDVGHDSSWTIDTKNITETMDNSAWIVFRTFLCSLIWQFVKCVENPVHSTGKSGKVCNVCRAAFW